MDDKHTLSIDKLNETEHMTTVVPDQDFAHKPCALSSYSTLTQEAANAQDSGHLVSYASYLRKLYSYMSQSQTSQHWSHLPRCEFIQLAMIGSGELRRGDREEEMVRLAQLGKIETIMTRKEPINLEKLFQTDQPLVILPSPIPPRVLLIEGVPGGGKSTLALHFCHEWAQGKCTYSLRRFDLVVLVYLRDQVIQNAITLTDILPARNFELSKSVASQIQDTSGENVLFIFDGWDEFPSHLQTNSLVSTIIQQPHKLSLHQSTVLITSRPVSSGNLLHIADRRVEILGFTQRQIREYIEKALDGNSTRIQKLVQHLEEHPVIEGYCYVPLHVAILVHIFLTMKEALPTTLHELFCDLVLCCIMRELETHVSQTDISAVSSLDDLPDVLFSKLSDISLLAYEGVMKNKVIFYHKDLLDLNLPASLPSLGLLQSVEGLTKFSKSLSHNFFHLSVQELLAAHYISHMDSNEQMDVFKRMFSSSRFQAVLHYYSGFTQLTNPAIRKFISTSSKQKSGVSDLLPFLHCFYEAQNLSLCSLVRSGFTGNVVEIDFHKLIPTDCLVIGYFIVYLLSELSAKDVCVRILSVDDEKLKFLLLELTKASSGRVTSCRTRRLEIEIRVNLISVDEVRFVMSHLKNLLVCSKLTIGDSIVSSDSFLQLTKELRNTDFFHITELNFVNTKLQLTNNQSKEEVGSILKEFFEMNKSLTHLTLSYSCIDPCYIFQGLQHNNTLVHLNLNGAGFFAADREALTTMLQVNNTLTHLDLSGNFLLLGSSNIFSALEHNTTLLYLNLSNTKLDDAVLAALITMLQINKTLTHLDLSVNFMPGSCNVFQALHHNTSLVHLNLSKTNLEVTGNTARALATMLKINKTLVHLDLSKNLEFFTSRQAVNFMCEGLRQNNTLRYLKLKNTGLNENSKSKILQAMNRNLKHDIIVDQQYTDHCTGSRCNVI